MVEKESASISKVLDDELPVFSPTVSLDVLEKKSPKKRKTVKNVYIVKPRKIVVGKTKKTKSVEMPREQIKQEIKNEIMQEINLKKSPMDDFIIVGYYTLHLFSFKTPIFI